MVNVAWVWSVVAGPVLELLVRRGDIVDADAEIARVQQVSLQTQLDSTQTREKFTFKR